MLRLIINLTLGDRARAEGRIIQIVKMNLKTNLVYEQYRSYLR